MKKIATFLVMLVVSITLMSAQGFKLDKVSVYSGLSALSSGLGAAINLKSEKSNLKIDFNASTAKILYTRKYGLFTFGPTGGTKSNTPWIAPIVMFHPNKHICLTSWNGIYFGEPGTPDWDIKYGFAYQVVDLTFGNLEIGYSFLNYMEDKPMNLPTIKYLFEVGGNDRVQTSFTYNMRDDAPLFFVSWTHSI
ncbi:MAG: hypothetical protein ABH884_00825 [Candidatus Komeilibacteria bacterium]